jgi:hypothetical protein
VHAHDEDFLVVRTVEGADPHFFTSACAVSSLVRSCSMRFFTVSNCVRASCSAVCALLSILAFDARELDTKIFTKLIDAFVHDHSFYNRLGSLLGTKVCCLI